MTRLRIFLIAIAFIHFNCIQAQESSKSVVIVSSKGEKFEYLLSTQPRLLQDHDKVILISDETTVEFETKNILKVYLSQADNAGLNNVCSSDGKFSFESGVIHLSGFKTGEAIRVYGLSGSKLADYKTDTEGSLTISLSALQNGANIIVTSNQFFKVIRK